MVVKSDDPTGGLPPTASGPDPDEQDQAILCECGRTVLVKVRTPRAGDAEQLQQWSKPRLAATERRCLELAAAGLTDKEIARTLSVSLDHAKHAMRDVYLRLDARNRAHAVSLGFALGVLATRLPTDVIP